jgi:hypothetical protein
MIDDIVMDDVDDTELQEMQPPAPVLVIENHHDKRITVDEDDDTLAVYLGDVLYIATSNEKYRAVLFSKCSSCKIKVRTKLLKLSFCDCSCDISITGGVVGVVELTRCKKTTVYINSDVPLLHVGQCLDTSFIQNTSEVIYVVSNSMDISASFENKRYQLSTLYREQIFSHISNKGLTRVSDDYHLNNIGTHIVQDIWERMTY